MSRIIKSLLSPSQKKKKEKKNILPGEKYFLSSKNLHRFDNQLKTNQLYIYKFTPTSFLRVHVSPINKFVNDETLNCLCLQYRLRRNAVKISAWQRWKPYTTFLFMCRLVYGVGDHGSPLQPISCYTTNWICFYSNFQCWTRRSQIHLTGFLVLSLNITVYE